MEEKTTKFAERLKDKLAGSTEPAHTDEAATELVESQLEQVSGGAHGSIHGSVDRAETPPPAQEG